MSPSNYPAGLDAFTTGVLTGIVSGTDHGNKGDAINKIEAELGTDPSGSAATVKARLETVESGHDFRASVAPFRWLSDVAVEQVSVGSEPWFIIPAASPGLRADKYGNVSAGPNENVPAILLAGGDSNTTTNTHPVFDFMYLAKYRRIFSRHGFFTEVANPANIQLGRAGANDTYPNHLGTGFTGITADNTLGLIVFRGLVSYIGQTPGVTPGAAFQTRAAQIYATSTADYIQTAPGNNFNTPGELTFATTPPNTLAPVDRLHIRDDGDVVLLNTNELGWRNAANSADLRVLDVDASNHLNIGRDDAVADISLFGQVMFYDDATSPTEQMRFDGNVLRWTAGSNEQTTVGAAGGASAPPATPTKYLKVKDSGGTTLVIAAYLAS